MAHYNYYRDYDPSIGRYAESDPIGLRGGLNSYSYVKSRPLTWRDDNGLESIPMSSPASAAAPGWLGDALGIGGRICTAPLALLIFAATASNNGDACSDDPSGKRQECKAKACEDEWKQARQVCRELIYEQMEQRAGRRKKRSVTGVTGGYTDVEQCAMGLVSEECGGNRVVEKK